MTVFQALLTVCKNDHFSLSHSANEDTEKKEEGIFRHISTVYCCTASARENECLASDEMNVCV